MPLAATMQAPDGLLVQFERPGQGQEDDPAPAVLEVKPVAFYASYLESFTL
jgi:hypothetical protein